MTTPSVADVRRLLAADPAASAWVPAALGLVELLHAEAWELPEEEHTLLCEESLPVAALLLGLALDADDRALVSDFASCVLLARFARLGDDADLAEAVRLRRAEAARTDSAWGCAARVNLAGALLVSAERTGSVPDLDEAGQTLDTALGQAATPEERAVVHGALGNVHLHRYDLRREPGDLRLAVEAFAAAARSPDPLVAARAQASLAAALTRRYHEESGDGEDLVRAERHIRAALAHPSPHWRELLVRILRDRYQHEGDAGLLEEAQATITALLDAHPDARAAWVSTASSVAYCRYLAHHERALLGEAIELTEEALATQALDAQDEAVLVNQICLLLTERFTLDGVRADVDRAIDLARQALAHRLPLSMELGVRTNLANALHRRYESYRQVKDLHDGIRTMRWVRARARRAVERATALHTLAVLLGDKALASGRAADFDEAIACVEEEIELTPASSSERAAALLNKADLVGSRAEATGAEVALGPLIELLEQAWHTSPADSAVRARAAYQLGYRRAERAGLYHAGPEGITLGEERAADLRAAMGLWRDAVLLDEPFVTIEAGQQLGNAAFALRSWEGAALGYRAALGAADALAERRTLAADQMLARFPVQGVAAAAALSALQAGSPHDAVLCLEQGSATLLARAAARQAERVEFDDVVAAARALSGPLVYWAATLAGGFAIVVRPDGRVVPADLPLLTTTEVENRLAALRAVFTRQEGETVLDEWAGAVRELLGWVWTSAVEPVVAELDGFPAAGLVPIGRLASLPLASLPLATAAPEGGRPLSWRTVPRLLPGSGAVVAREPWPAAPRVALLCDPGHGSRRLPHAFAEAELVAACHPGVRPVVVPGDDDMPGMPVPAGRRALRAQGTVPHVGGAATERDGTAGADGSTGGNDAASGDGGWIDVVGSADLAHLICHYDLDPDQPLDSVVRLGAGVTVARLLERRFPGSPHLVLSACDTGLSGVQLPDEVIGLGTVLLTAGARSVVASLWPLDDELAAAFMGRYHRRLAAGEDPAAALAAVQREATGEHDVVVWPGLVHLG
ncbi:CHAT domain-containing protein [Nonomuraea fuscirosea]|uniref:CHAT domain-containing protein n=1 Tax=Nonomuraea fuscirosea TaxID=1291556 RepID=UPI002DDB5519|nr:CHAT domain-containing protein [Nonomuraea fuscirosea]WSA57413.1 CHAT domain-containing protein [Nonomuraea fuscirosea]